MISLPVPFRFLAKCKTEINAECKMDTLRFHWLLVVGYFAMTIDFFACPLSLLSLPCNFAPILNKIVPICSVIG
jgi:hypothetical protein